MLDLFRLEAEEQLRALTAGLLALERAPTDAVQLEACMRAAHSFKGAAHIVGLKSAATVAHSLEDCFVAAQRGHIVLERTQIDLLLRGVDLLNRIATTPGTNVAEWTAGAPGDVQAFVSALAATLEVPAASAEGKRQAALVRSEAQSGAPEPRESPERAVRVTAQRLNRLVGFAAESLVESRWLKPFAKSMLRLKRKHYDVAKAFDELREALPALDTKAHTALAEMHEKVLELHGQLSERLTELENFDRRSVSLAHRLYDEALTCRMRPFADGVAGFPRMVRDLARSLDKHVRLDIVGDMTWLDRDILERLDGPLGHLLRNAVDHGIESPQERSAAGKPSEAVVGLEVSQSAGMLQISISDDGRGIDADDLRAAVVKSNLATADVAHTLTEAEIYEFLFLPGFTMKGTVTQISGRGVGLDVVRTMLKGVGGSVRVTSHVGKGTRFHMQLPLSLSVVRTLIADIGGEPYAFPLAYIVSTLKLRRNDIESMEGRPLFDFDGRRVGLVGAQQVLQGGDAQILGDELPVIILGASTSTYGLVTDRFIGERELVVQALDARLGKIKNISAGALMEDGSPALVVDVDDLIRSIESLVSAGNLSLTSQAVTVAAKRRKRILVVDDSLTVRALVRKLLENAGYEVEVAINGVDGWNSMRSGGFDLIVTDIDMPRMDGIELVATMKKDPHLKSLPIVIVSYKDRAEDRRRGLEAGADYFLSKGSFHDETLVQTIRELIGAAAA